MLDAALPELPERSIMIIKCWGSRGSIPVSGKKYVKYGGDTTCLEIRNKTGDIIIVDAGTGIRRLGNHLLGETHADYHFIFTHAHWDHLMGFPFFKPLHSQGVRLLMYRCPFQNRYVETVLTSVMSPPYFPVKYADVGARIEYIEACPIPFRIGSLEIIPIPISHPNGGSGYKFVEDGKIFVFLTDNELGFVHRGGLSHHEYVKFVAGADLLIHDAEYTPEEYGTTKGWGHTVYPDAVRLAGEARAKQLGLFHLNQDRNDQDMDRVVDDCRRIVHEANWPLDCFAVGADATYPL